MDDPEYQWVAVDVRPECRRVGIGSAVYEGLIAEAERRSLRGVRVTVRAESPEGLAFVAKRNFVERRRVWRSRLELTSADTSAMRSLLQELSDGGIRFTTLAEEGADDPRVLARVHQLNVDAGGDTPVLGPHTAIAFDDFRRFFLEGPAALPEAWFLATHGGEYVGISFAARDPARPDSLQQHFTGVRREYRRRKIALALKLLLIDFAQRHGFAHIDTSNDSMNTPMWTLNQGLGFHKSHERIQLECPLARSDRGARPPNR